MGFRDQANCIEYVEARHIDDRTQVEGVIVCHRVVVAINNAVNLEGCMKERPSTAARGDARRE
jgi:hypothetical protein